MRLNKLQAIEILESDDLIGIGMEADAARRKFHPEPVATYIIDRNINHTNFCTEYCSFCAFYRPMGHEEGYVLSKEAIGQKIQETIDVGGTGVLMQGGVNPDLKIEYFEDLFSWIKKNYQIHLHCLSAPEILTVAEVSNLTIEDTIKRMRDAGLDSIPGAGAEVLDDEVRRVDRRTPHRSQARRADHRDDDVRLRRDVSAPRQPSRDIASDARRDRRIHGVYPLAFSA